MKITKLLIVLFIILSASSSFALTTGSLSLSSTINSISVKAAFTNGTASTAAAVQYRVTGTSIWRDACSQCTFIDLRATINGTTNIYVNQARVSIVGLSANTSYDVRVTWADNAGVTGTNPVTGVISTVNLSPPLGGGVITVTNNTQLTSALNQVNPGQTIHLNTGSYANFAISRSGTAGAWIKIEGPTDNSAQINGTGVNQNISVNGNFIILSHLRIMPSDFSGIVVAGGVHDLFIQDTTMDNISALCAQSITNHYGDAGISLGNNVSNIRMLRNTITSIALNSGSCTATPNYNSPGTGIQWSNGVGVVADSNIITGGFRDCISVDDTTDVSENSDISNNTCTGYKDDGPESKGGNVNARIWGNIINATAANTCIAGNNNPPLTNLYGPLYIFRNTCRVTTTNPTGTTVYKLGPSVAGFWVPTYIIHNTIDSTPASPRWDGVVGRGAVVAYNNILKSSGSAIDFIAASSIFDYNLMTVPANINFAFNWDGTTSYSTWAQWRTATGQELHGLNVDPSFIDTALHIANNSPAVDRGIVLNNFNSLDSMWPYNGNAPDMGALETGGGPINHPPTAVDDIATTLLNTAVTVQVLSNDSDPDGNAISIQSFTQGSHGTVAFNGPHTALVYTPTTGYTGSDTFNYTIVDTNNATATALVSIIINPPPNNPPIAVNDIATTLKNTAVTIQVLSNDHDPDGDAISIQSFTQGANGSVIAASSPSALVYTPVSNYTGSDSFTYTIQDTHNATAIASVAVTINAPPNNPPIAINDTSTTQQNVAVDVHPLSNDFDPDGDAISIQSFAQPSHGTTVNGSSAGVITYTPTTNYTGNDSFTYTISDGRGGTATATVSLTVNVIPPPPNRPPVAVNDSVTTIKNIPVTFNVLSNDSDPDGDAISVVSHTNPVHGIVTNAGGPAGSYIYTPNNNYTGGDTFTYIIQDTHSATATASVILTVTIPPNQPPVAVNDVASTLQNTRIDVQVLSNDFDPDGDPINVQSFAQPLHGSVARAGNPNILSYTPSTGYIGNDSFTYAINDPQNATATATVSITVNALPNNPPVAINDTVTMNENTTVLIHPMSNDYDPDGDAISILSFAQGSHGTVVVGSQPGELSYTPLTDYIGTDSFIYTIKDSHNATAAAAVNITVNQVQIPQIPSQPFIRLRP